MTDIQADYDLLKDVADRFHTQEQESAQLRQRLTQSFAALEDGGWIGLGADAFFEQMHTVVFPALERLERALERGRSITMQSADKLQQAEDDAAKLFQHDHRQLAGSAGGAASGVVAAGTGGVASRSGGGDGGRPAAASGNGTAGAVAPGTASGGGSRGGGGGSSGGGGGGGSSGGGGGAQANPQEQKTEEEKKREQAKKTAADMAVAANDAAAVFTMAGGASTAAGAFSLVGTLAGIGVGAVFGICAGAAWFVGNRYQKLANDPPRPDFQAVARFAPRELDLLSVAGGERNVLNDFVSSQIQLAAATDDLVTSIERYDGARIAAAKAMGEELARIGESATRQREAIAHNAQACALLIDSTIQLTPNMNEVWDAQVQRQRADNGGRISQPVQDAVAEREDVLAGIVRALGEMAQFTPDDITGFRRAASAAPSSAQPPQDLISAQWLGQMRTMAGDLRELADAYSRGA